MSRSARIGILALIAGAAACADAGGPEGPAEKALAFALSAPGSVPTKQAVELEIRVTRASLVHYPLTVTFEEANRSQPYTLVATVLLQKPEDEIARIFEDAARDPLYRVTICEAAPAARLCVSKTAQVDVLDFP